MFHEYPNDVTLNGGGFVKQVGRNSFNGGMETVIGSSSAIDPASQRP
jgi:hypothetical protein